jgi:methylated-DNA-[protein]-cysteine S-methyltransferase
MRLANTNEQAASLQPSLVRPSLHRYEVPDWGVGELWLDGDRVLWSELPRPSESTSAHTAGHPLTHRLAAYFGGAPDDFADVDLDLEDGFYGDCARALRAVPRGEVVTYGELAALAGRPGAARAAGTFCARNRLGLFVPCHRVVAAGGIGSYGSLGLDYKRRLLALEHVVL